MPESDLITFRHETGVEVATLPEAFRQTVTVRPDAVALRTVGGIQEITWTEYAQRVEAIATGLAALGDTVGIMLTNRPEFHLVDTAVLHLGATPFSIYNTSSPEQIEYRFGNAGNTVVITEQVFLPLIRAASTNVTTTIVVDGVASEPSRWPISRSRRHRTASTSPRRGRPSNPRISRP
jgi:long-subunit acyl-CoA synthetase (AMP-forming)